MEPIWQRPIVGDKVQHMKKVIAYVNTQRVHWLVEGLEAVGIKEIMVTEYFSPSSRISRMELIAEDDEVENIRGIIHRVGTTGEAGDHSFFVEEYDPKLPSQIPLGRRTSKLEESRVKQLVNFMLHGSHRKIRVAFLFITISILGVTIFIYVQTDSVQRSAKGTNETVKFLSETTNAVESAVLEEMLAVERFHRGEAASAFREFRKAREKLINGISALKETNIVGRATVDSLSNLEHQFHLIAGGMFDVVDSLSHSADVKYHRKIADVSKSHYLIMSSLDVLRLQLLALLSSLEEDTGKLAERKQQEMNSLIEDVRFSLLFLATGTIVISITIWLLIERNVSRPIRKLVEETKTIDTVELK